MRLSREVVKVLRSESVGSPSDWVEGRIISKASALACVDMSMPTFNVHLKKNNVQHIDNPESGEKGLILEDLCKSFGSIDILKELDREDGSNGDVNAVSATTGRAVYFFKPEFVTELLDFAMREKRLASFDQLIERFVTKPKGEELGEE